MKRFTASAVLLSTALTATLAFAEPIVDRLVRQLRGQGFTEITVKRTWLGRVRIAAEGKGVEREIILNPRTGEILRDFWKADENFDAKLFETESGRGGSSGSGGSDDDENEDDESGEDDSEDDESDDNESDDSESDDNESEEDDSEDDESGGGDSEDSSDSEDGGEEDEPDEEDEEDD